MKRFLGLVLLVMLAALPVCALAGCQCVQPNEYQIGFDEATCTEPGYYVLKCADCGGTWREKAKDKLGHNYQYAQTNPALCESDGKEWFECTRCGDTQYQTIPKMGHDYRVTSTVDATCTKDGKKTYTCSRLGCGSQKSETIPATGKHKWEAVSALGATCDSPKTVTYQCSVCNEKKTEKEGSPAEHNWQQTYSEPATCAADGYKSYKCASCSKDKIETIPATGKCTYGEWIVAVNASCDKDGLKVAACTQCGDKKEQKIPATGHKWKDGQVTKQPTCTEDGKATSVCTVCGKTDNARTIQKLGHSYSKAITTKQATCTEKGEKSATCSTCGAIKKTTIDAKGHSFGEWKVTKEATTKETGTKERTCSVCGKKETQTIPKKGTVTPTPKPTNTPKPAATAKKSTKSSKSSASNLTADEGSIEIYTTSGKVNLRTGPGKKNGTAGQIAKKNTNLGAMIEAQADNSGTVWYKVRYKNKNRWITSDYARAVVGDMTGLDERYVGADSHDLSDVFFCYIDQAAEHYGLEMDMGGTIEGEGILMGGSSDFIDYIELTGEGYSIYGVEVGDKIKQAESAMKKNGLYCASKAGSTYVFKRPCLWFSLYVNDEGFDSYIEIELDSSKCVEAIYWNAYTE